MLAFLLIAQIWYFESLYDPFYPEPPTYPPQNYAFYYNQQLYQETRYQFNSQFNRQQANMAALVERKRYHRERKLRYIRAKNGQLPL